MVSRYKLKMVSRYKFKMVFMSGNALEIKFLRIEFSILHNSMTTLRTAQLSDRPVAKVRHINVMQKIMNILGSNFNVRIPGPYLFFTKLNAWMNFRSKTQTSILLSRSYWLLDNQEIGTYHFVNWNAFRYSIDLDILRETNLI